MIGARLFALPYSTMLKCEHHFPCLHHIHMDYDPRLVINGRNIIYIYRKKPRDTHKILNFFKNLFLHIIRHFPPYPIRPMFQWLPMPYQHVSIYNPTLELRAYLCHCWIHNHAFKLPYVNCMNINRWIVIRRSNISGKNYVTKKVFIFEVLKGMYF